MVRRHWSLWLPFGPHTAGGRAPIGCGGSTTPPTSASAFSRSSHVLTSVSPGSTPTVPMNAAIGTRTPGISSDVAASRSSFQLTTYGSGNRSRRKPKPGTITVYPY